MPDPVPINALEVKWKIITSENVQTDAKWVYFALDSKGYENLSITQAETLRWIEEAAWRLRYYNQRSKGEESD